MGSRSFQQALEAENRGDYAGAVIYLNTAIRKGNAEAYAELGRFYRDGLGVAADADVAFELFRKAADRGSGAGMFYAGIAYLDGEGTQQNSQMAALKFVDAARYGIAEAASLLGDCYERGVGVPVDYAKAFQCYKKAVDLGDTDAVLQLARCYESGIGVPADPTVASVLRTSIVNNGQVNSYGTQTTFSREGNHHITITMAPPTRSQSRQRDSDDSDDRERRYLMEKARREDAEDDADCLACCVGFMARLVCILVCCDGDD